MATADQPQPKIPLAVLPSAVPPAVIHSRPPRPAIPQTKPERDRLLEAICGLLYLRCFETQYLLLKRTLPLIKGEGRNFFLVLWTKLDMLHSQLFCSIFRDLPDCLIARLVPRNFKGVWGKMAGKFSRAHSALMRAYRSIHARMRWLNMLAERGLRLRNCQSKKAVTNEAASRENSSRRFRRRAKPRPASATGLRRMESLEMRVMLATHDGAVPGAESVYTFAVPQGYDQVIIQPAPSRLDVGLITAKNTAGRPDDSLTETFTNFSRLVVDATAVVPSGSKLDIKFMGETSLQATGLLHVDFFGSAGDDQFEVSATAVSGLEVAIDGNGGTDEILGNLPNDTVSKSFWTITQPGVGNWKAGETASVNFTQIENIVGVADHEDIFEFQNGARLAGTVTGQLDDLDAAILHVTAGEVSREVWFEDGAVTVDQEVIYRHVNIADSENLVVTTTDSDDHVAFEATSDFGTFAISSQNGAFQPVTFNQPVGLTTLALAGGNDSVWFPAAGLADLLGLVVDGGGGEDALYGPPPDSESEEVNTWLFDARNQGNLNDLLFFVDVENITGTPNAQDTFVFTADGRLTGRLAGQSTEADTILVQLEVGSSAERVVFENSQIAIEDEVVVSHVGVGSFKNVLITGTKNNDQIELRPGTVSGTLELLSAVQAFSPIVIDRPDSVRIEAGEGDDGVTIDAACLPTAITVVGEGGTDTLSIAVSEPQTPLDISLAEASADAGFLSVNGTTIAYSGIEETQNIIFEGTSASDSFLLTPRDSRLAVVVNEKQVTFDQPADSLAIYGFAGDDIISLANDIVINTPVVLDGGTDVDSLSLGGQLASIRLASTHEVITTSAVIGDLTFTTTAADDSLRLSRGAPDELAFTSLNDTFSSFALPQPTNGLRIETGDGNDSVQVELDSFSPALFVDGQRGEDTLTIPSGEFADLGFSIDAVSSDANVQHLSYTTTDGEVEVERDPVTSRLLIRDANGEALLRDPTEHFTILAGGQSADDTIESLDRDTDLTHVSMRQLVLSEDLTVINDGGTHDFAEDVSAPGHDITVRAGRINVLAGVTVSTHATAGDAGDISLIASGSSPRVAFAADSKVLAHSSNPERSHPGDITIRAEMSRTNWALFYRGGTAEATITVDSATLKGGAITLESSTDAGSPPELTAPSDNGWLNIPNSFLGYLTSLSPIAGVAVSSATSSIDVQGSSVISGTEAVLTAQAVTTAQVRAFNERFTVAICTTTPTARINVGAGTQIVSSGAIALTTEATSNLSASASQGLLGPNRGAATYSFALSVGHTEATSEAIVHSGTAIQAGGDITIRSVLNKSHNTKAEAGAFAEGSVGLGLAVSEFTSSIKAEVNGTMIAGGNVVIDASVSTSSNRTYADATVGLGGKAKFVINELKGKYSPPLDLLAKINPFLRLPDITKTGEKKEHAFGGAVAYAEHDDTVAAVIAPGAHVTAVNGSVSVLATAHNLPQTGAVTDIESDKLTYANQREKALAIATSIGLFQHTVKSVVSSGATLTAGSSVVVKANTSLPRVFRAVWDEPGVGSTLQHVNGDFGARSSWFASWTRAQATGNKVALAGSVNYFSVTNDVTAAVELDAHVTAVGDVEVRAAVEGNLLHVAGNGSSPLGLITGAFGDLKSGLDRHAETAVGAGYGHIATTNTINAEIAAGAIVDGASVSLTADNHFHSTGVAVASGVTSGSGFNGSGMAGEVTNRTQALISEDATIITRGGTASSLDPQDISVSIPEAETSLLVSANDDGSIFSFAGGVLRGRNVGFGVSVAVNIVDRKTQASIGSDPDTAPVSDPALAPSVTALGGISVRSVSGGSQVAVPLAAAVNQSTGSKDYPTGAAAAAVSWNEVSSTTRSFVSGGPAAVAAIATQGDLTVTAADTSSIVSVTPTLAYQSETRTDSASGSVGVSVTSNDVSQNVEARLHNVTLDVGGSVSVLSAGEADIQSHAMSGALTLSAGNAGTVAATHATNTITGNIQSTMTWVTTSSEVDASPESISVMATRENSVDATCVSAAIASNSGADGFSLTGGGAGAENTISGSTEASMSDSEIRARGNLSLQASDTSEIWAVLPSFAVGVGSHGIGIGVAVATNEIRDASTSSFITRSDVYADGVVSVLATATQEIEAYVGSIAAMATSSDLSVSAVGSGAQVVNDIAMNIKAEISNATQNGLSGSAIRVRASDTSNISAACWGIATSVGVGSFAIGVSLVRNTVKNEVEASLRGMTSGVESQGGSVEVRSQENASLEATSVAVSLAVGISGGGFSVSGGGAEATNVVLSSSVASIESSNVVSAGDVIVDASMSGNSLFALGSGVTDEILNMAGDLATRKQLPAGISTEEEAVLDSLLQTIRNAFLPEGLLDGERPVDIVTLAEGAHWQITDGRDEVFFVGLRDDELRVFRPMIEAEVVTVAAAGTKAGTGLAIGGSRVRNFVGHTQSGEMQRVKIHANVTHSNIEATDGQLRQSATNALTISGNAHSGAAGVTLTGQFGVGGAGSRVRNRIATDVAATITGDGPSVAVGSPSIRVRDLILTASDRSVVSGKVGAISIAGSFGTGGTLSVGVGLSRNDVSSHVTASIDDVEVFATGDVSLRADDQTIISSTVWAASVAASVGGSFAAGGAGIEAINNLDNRITASIRDAALELTDDNHTLTIIASQDSDVSSRGYAVGVAGSKAVSLAAVGGLARNETSNVIDATLSNSQINTSPADSQNPAADTEGTIQIEAMATGSFDTQVVGAVLALAGNFAGAVGVARALNIKEDEVRARVTGGNLRSHRDLTIRSRDKTNLISRAYAAAVSGSPTGAISGGGAEAVNTERGTVETKVSNGAKLWAGNKMTVQAVRDTTFHADVASVAVAVGHFGASVGVSVLRNTDESKTLVTLDNAELTAGFGGVDIQAIATSYTSQARGIATSVAVAIGGAGAGANARTTLEPTVTTSVDSLARITAAGDVAIESVLVADAFSETWGATGGLVAIGGSESFADANGMVATEVAGSLTARNILLSSDAKTTAVTESEALAGGLALGVAGTGAISNASPTVTASVGSMSSFDVAGRVRVDAQSTPRAASNAYGVAVTGSVGVGVANARATASPIISARYDSQTKQTDSGMSSLQVTATTHQPDSGLTAYAKAKSGAGGFALGAMGATAHARTMGSTVAELGEGAYIPNGDVHVYALTETSQAANAWGVSAGGIAGVGGVDANVTAGVQTTASIGNSIQSQDSRHGKLLVDATGLNKNDAGTIGGTGGALTGVSSRCNITDTSTATTHVGNGSIHAEDISLTANQSSYYSPNADAYFGGLVGGGDPRATTTLTTGATATVARSAVLTADSAIVIRANNKVEHAAENRSVSGGGGVLVGGSTARSATTLTGTANVTLQDQTELHAATITLATSHDVRTNERAWFPSGAALGGSTAVSDIQATLNNRVSIGENAMLAAREDVLVGTVTNASVTASADVHFGAVGGSAHATSSVTATSSQAIAIGSNTTVLAGRNVHLVSGDDTSTSRRSSFDLHSRSNAFGYFLFAIPTAAASVHPIDETVLHIARNSQVTAGGNIVLAARETTVNSSETGRIYWNSIQTGGFSRSTGSLRNPVSRRQVVTNDGIVTAGIYNKLEITIPDARNAAVSLESFDDVLFTPDSAQVIGPTGNGIFSRTIHVNQSGSPFLPFSVTPIPRFSPSDYIGQIAAPEVADLLLNSVTAGDVYALRFDGLAARGGTVTLDASSFAGNGSVTAHGGPEVSIKNHSPTYVLIGDVVIPNIDGGVILFPGISAANSARAAGITLTEVNPRRKPHININNFFTASRSSTTGSPTIFLDGSIQNLGGTVSITNLHGSIGQFGAIHSADLSIYAPHGMYAVSIAPPQDFNLGSPEAAWSHAELLPGGNPSVAGWNAHSAAQWGAAYATNAHYNYLLPSRELLRANYPSRVPGFTYFTPQFNQYLLTGAGEPASSGFRNTVVIFGGSIPRAGRSLGGSNFNSAELSQSTSRILSPVSQTQGMPNVLSRANTVYHFPTVPLLDLSTTQSEVRETHDPTSTDALVGIQSASVAIHAKYINVNATISSGSKKDVQVVIDEDDAWFLNYCIQIFDELNALGIVPPSPETNDGIHPEDRVAELLATIDSLTTEETELSNNVLKHRILWSQYLGYFNGTNTAKIPLVKADRSAYGGGATWYTTKVIDGAPPISSTLSPSAWNNQFPQNAAQPWGPNLDYTTLFDDSLATVSFDLQSRSIHVDGINTATEVSHVMLRGGILNTSSQAKILVAGDAGGQVGINNHTDFPLVLSDIKAASETQGAVVDIVDTLKDPSVGHSVYVYEPYNGRVRTYIGSIETTAEELLAAGRWHYSSGFGVTEAQYLPVLNARWEWIKYAEISRDFHLELGDRTFPWRWSTPGVTESDRLENPWVYVSDSSTGADGSSLINSSQAGGYLSPTPVGNVSITDGREFEAATGRTQERFSSRVEGGLSNFDSIRVRSDYIGNIQYNHPRDGWLKVTSSVKADHPFSIEFDGTDGNIAISSNGGLELEGTLSNPRGTVTLATAGVFTATPAASIASHEIIISAPNSAVGTEMLPINVTTLPKTSHGRTTWRDVDGSLQIAAGGSGIWVASPSSHRLGLRRLHTNGDLTVMAGGSIVSVERHDSRGRDTTVLTGRNISVTSKTGSVGERGRVVGGSATWLLTVNAGERFDAKAKASVYITSRARDLPVGEIVAGNDVVLWLSTAVVSADKTVYEDLFSEQAVEELGETFNLFNATATEAKVTQLVNRHQQQVTEQYKEYWRLVDVSDSDAEIFTLTPGGRDLFRSQATETLALANPATDEEVDKYISNKWTGIRDFFSLTFNAEFWQRAATGDKYARESLDFTNTLWMARPEFKVFDPAYAYISTTDQVNVLTVSLWISKDEIKSSISTDALLDAGIVLPPAESVNVTAQNFTVFGRLLTNTVRSSIGRQGSTVEFPYSALVNNNLTADQQRALRSANAPGEVKAYGIIDGEERLLPYENGAFENDVVPTRLVVTPRDQLVVNIPGAIHIDVLEDVFLQNISDNGRLGRIRTGGEFDIKSLSQNLYVNPFDISSSSSIQRPPLQLSSAVNLSQNVSGPLPIVFGKSNIGRDDVEAYVITTVSSGIVERYDERSDTWRDISTPPKSSNPFELMRLLQDRLVTEHAVLRWIPGPGGETGQNVFNVIGWNNQEVVVDDLDYVEPFTLQLLHGKAGIQADDATNVPLFGAMIDHYDDQFETVVAFAGDTFAPGSWAQAASDPSVAALVGSDTPGHADIEILNLLGVDVSALGTDDFSYGETILASDLQSADFPYLAANLDFSSAEPLRAVTDRSIGGLAQDYLGNDADFDHGKIVPRTVVEVGGERVGFIGLTVPDTDGLLTPFGVVMKDDDDASTNSFDEVVQIAQAQIDALTAQGINKVILLVQDSDFVRTILLAQSVRGVDVVLASDVPADLGSLANAFDNNGPDSAENGGYPFQTTDANGDPVMIVGTDSGMGYLGRLVVTFDRDGLIVQDLQNVQVAFLYPADEQTLQAITGRSESAEAIIADSEIGSGVKEITDSIQRVLATGTE